VKVRTYSHVPWLEDSDLRPMGEPETSLDSPTQRVLGLHIPYPFGTGTDAMLAIRATVGNGNDGGEITLSIATCIGVDL
jgi:hypothetical protein